MLVYVDYYFFYKYTLRNILMNKYKFNNTYSIPFLKELTMFIPLRKMEGNTFMETREAYNYFYLFKFFFGYYSFINSFKSSFNVGLWTYSYNIQLSVKKKNIFNVLFYLLNDVLYLVDKSFLSSGIFSKDLNILYVNLRDLNLFSEKKTNLGLFNLNSELNILFKLGGGDHKTSKVLLKNFKLFML